jgi:integrase
LISPQGAKSFRACYYFPGSALPHYIHLGRVGELRLSEARQRCGQARRLAREGKDPKASDPGRSGTFETVFREWVERIQIGREQNKSARKTESFVLSSLKPWLGRPVATIQYSEIEKLLDQIRDGDGAKVKPRPAAANRLYAHLRGFFSWCARHGGPLQISPLQGMRPPAKLSGRNRVYSADELRAIWRAADKLDPAESSYVKLIMLVALRKEELALAKWSQLDDAQAPKLLTVPFERTKGKITRKPIVYRVPLPPLAARILAGLPRRDDDLFARIDYQRLKTKLVALGAPRDFKLHVFRHTIATHLENNGKTEWERGLVLNHSSSTVTAGYSHGFAGDLKLKLLSEWADHVEGLVQPSAKVSVLR